MKATIRTWPRFVMTVLAVVAVAIGLSSAWATAASADSPPTAQPAAVPSVAAPAAATPVAGPAAEPTAEAPPAAPQTDQRGWAPRSLLAVGVASSGVLLLGAAALGLAQRRKTQRQQDKSATVRGPARARPNRSPRLIGAHSSQVYALQLQLRHRRT